MDYMLARLGLMVTGIALSKGRHFFFCLLYFYVWMVFKYFAPSAAPWGPSWYWLCILGESSVFVLALIVKPNARTLILAASTIQILTNSVSTLTPAIYDYYPSIIRCCEITQGIVMVTWSPMVLGQLQRISNRLKGTVTWTLRLLQQKLT